MTQIAARLPEGLVRKVDRAAREDNRTRTGQIAELIALGLAGRERLKQLERLGRSGIASTAQRPETQASEAGRAHLAEHRRMCGFDSPSEETSDHD